MRILSTIYLDRPFRAYDRANGATRAFISFSEDRSRISAGVHFRRHGNYLLGAKRNAKCTAFAEFARNIYFPFHLTLSAWLESFWHTLSPQQTGLKEFFSFPFGNPPCRINLRFRAS